MAVFAYIRIATAQQLSMDRQLDLIRDYATERGLELPEENIYRDVSSGNTSVFARLGFAELWSRIQPEDILLVEHIDRLVRSLDVLAECLNALIEQRIRLQAVRKLGDD